MNWRASSTSSRALPFRDPLSYPLHTIINAILTKGTPMWSAAACGPSHYSSAGLEAAESCWWHAFSQHEQLVSVISSSDVLCTPKRHL